MTSCSSVSERGLENTGTGFTCCCSCCYLYVSIYMSIYLYLRIYMSIWVLHILICNGLVTWVVATMSYQIVVPNGSVKASRDFGHSCNVQNQRPKLNNFAQSYLLNRNLTHLRSSSICTASDTISLPPYVIVGIAGEGIWPLCPE